MLPRFLGGTAADLYIHVHNCTDMFTVCVFQINAMCVREVVAVLLVCTHCAATACLRVK